MRKQKQPCRSRRSHRPLTLEVLEDRCLLSYTLTDLGTLGGTFTVPFGLNDAGQVVGESRTANANNGTHPFLWDSSTGMQDLGTLGGSYPNSAAYAINSQGMVAGQAVTGPGVLHAFFYRNGTKTDLGQLPGVYSMYNSAAYSLNDAGQVVGYANFVAVPYEYAFLWDSQNGIQNLGALGGEFSYAYGINASGQVVGDADVTEDDSVRHAFVWDRQNGMQDLNSLIPPTSGLELNQARAINDVGQIVGYANNYPQIQAYLYSAGTVTGLGFLPGFVNSWATAINNAGQVVGSVWNFSNARVHAFVYADGAMADLNDLVPPDSGLILAVATGINNAGQIACTATDAMGHTHAVLLTPDGGGGASGGAGISVPDVFPVLASVPETAHIGPITNNQPPANTLREPAPVETVASLPANAVVCQATDALFASNHRPQPGAARPWDEGERALEQSLDGGLILST
jgi:probable HAF family extracellular repeat protein